MSMKLLNRNIAVTLLAIGFTALLLTGCQKEEPKSPFEQMGESMNKAAKEVEKTAEEMKKAAEETQ